MKYKLTEKLVSDHFKHTIRDFCAGWVGGIAGLIIGHPFDTLKVRHQTLDFKLKSLIRTTYKYEGIRGFYKGFWAPFLIIGPSNAVFFSVYGTCLRLLQDSKEDNLDYTSPYWLRRSVIAGLFAGFFQAWITCPSELIKTVMQMEFGQNPLEKNHIVIQPNYRSTSNAILSIYKIGGITGFYKGAVPTLWRDIPASAVFTLVYEWTSHRRDDQPFWEKICAGGIAGIACQASSVHFKNILRLGELTKTFGQFGPINFVSFLGVASWLSTLPFDVVKSRIQSDNPHDPRYKGMMDCIYKSYKAEGLKVFSNGITLITIRAFPVNAAILIGYEQTEKLLKAYF